MNETEFAALRADFHAVARDVRDIKHALEGNGKPGLKMQVDRLERSWALAAWMAGLAFASSVALFVKAFWGAMKGPL